MTNPIGGNNNHIPVIHNLQNDQQDKYEKILNIVKEQAQKIENLQKEVTELKGVSKTFLFFTGLFFGGLYGVYDNCKNREPEGSQSLSLFPPFVYKTGNILFKAGAGATMAVGAGTIYHNTRNRRENLINIGRDVFERLNQQEENNDPDNRGDII